MRLKIEHRIVGSSVHVVLSGFVDWSTLPQLRITLRRLVSRPYPNVVLDVGAVTSWSTEAQLVLVRSIAQARLNGGELLVTEFAVPQWHDEGSMLPDRLPNAGRVQRHRRDRCAQGLRPNTPMSVGLRLVPPLREPAALT